MKLLAKQISNKEREMQARKSAQETRLALEDK